MSKQVNSERSTYTPVARWLHWLMALIWLSAWVIGYIGVTWRESLNPHHGLTMAHKAIASTILFLIVLRIFWRLTHPTPELPDSMTSLMKMLAHAGHFLLYLVALIALPVSGWLWSSVADKPVMVLWLFELPPLTSPRPEYYEIMKDVHVTLAFFTAALVAGHILMAIKHAIFDKDGVMDTMLPGTEQGRKRRSLKGH